MRKEDIFIGTQEEIENYIKENFKGHNSFPSNRLPVNTQIEDLKNNNGFGCIFIYHYTNPLPPITNPSEIPDIPTIEITLTKINVWLQN